MNSIVKVDHCQDLLISMLKIIRIFILLYLSGKSIIFLVEFFTQDEVKY